MKTLSLISLLVALIFQIPSNAQDGSLDPEFGTNGKVITAIGNFDDEARAIALQADGKIVVAGHSLQGNYYDFATVRYLRDGKLDPGFGNGGFVLTDLGDNIDKATAIAIQTDGKILLAGHSYQDSRDVVAVVRYHADGQLDNSFNQTGKLLIPVSTTGSYCTAIALQSDGKIVLTGGTQNNGQFDLLVIRINTNGTLDSGFDTDGIRIYPVTSFLSDFANTMLIQPDQKIVVAGYTNGGNNADMLLVRFLPDGQLDLGFGSNGKVQQAITGTHSETASSIVQQPDGKLVVAGNTTNTFFDDVLVRFHSDGTLDNTFGNNGISVTDHGIQSDFGFPVSMALQSDGRLVTAGYRTSGNQLYFSVVRYRSDGTLDFGFGSDGRVTTEFEEGKDQSAYALAIQPDGKIIAAGGSYKDQNRIALARYNAGNTVSTGKPIPVSDGLKVYPNPCPANGTLTVQHPNLKEAATIEIITWNGTSIGAYKTQRGSSQSTIQVPNLVPGVYMVRTTHSNNPHSSTLLTIQ